MTTKEAKNILHGPNRAFVLLALSFVNLTDKETDVLILRHLRGHTQEVTAEEIEMSVNGVQNIEKSALNKCVAVWKDLNFIKKTLNTTS